MKDASNNQSTKSSTLGKNAKVLPHHLEDLQRSGLSDETIEALGFYSATADEV
jgi:hypothetical protein